MSRLHRRRILRLIGPGCLLILLCLVRSGQAQPRITSVRVVPVHGQVSLGESVPLEAKIDPPDAPVTFKWVIKEGSLQSPGPESPSAVYIPPNEVGTYLVRVQLLYRDKKVDEQTLPIKVVAKPLPGSEQAPLPSLSRPSSAWFSGRQTVGSPHGDLPAGAQAVSPDGQFRAQLASSGTQVDLYNAKTNTLLGAIAGDGTNPPKAFAFSPEGVPLQLAVLFHHKHEGKEVNVVEIRSVETRQPLQSIPFTGQAYYHEIGYAPDGKHIGLRLQWQGRWAVIDLATEQLREGQN